MGPSQDSATQSQELTDEQKEALQVKHEDIREKTRATCASIASIEDPETRARVHSELLRELTQHTGTSNEMVFQRVLNEYPDSIELTAEFEGVEMEVANHLSDSHEVSTSISVENQYVDIEVEVDLRNEVEEMCAVNVEKDISFDGCDIIEAYMDGAGTDNPVFFLAKVTQLLFDKGATEARRVERNKMNEEFDQKLSDMKGMRDVYMKEHDVDFNKMQARVFALTDVLQGLHDNTFEGTIDGAILKAIEEHGLSGDK